jgi:hypothetical protein
MPAMGANVSECFKQGSRWQIGSVFGIRERSVVWANQRPYRHPEEQTTETKMDGESAGRLRSPDLTGLPVLGCQINHLERFAAFGL